MFSPFFEVVAGFSQGRLLEVQVHRYMVRSTYVPYGEYLVGMRPREVIAQLPQ